MLRIVILTDKPAAVRIIAGEFRGRRLLAPAGDATRPITDRAKQSLFDILAPLLPDAIVFDCFAGTGSMGLESLSRGASQAIFFERDRIAVHRLKQNIQAFEVDSRSRVMTGDIFRHFRDAGTTQPAFPAANVVFLDPPYHFLNDQPHDVQTLAGDILRQLDPNGIVVFRHDIHDELNLAPLLRYDQRDYGGMRIELLRKAQ